MQEMKAPGKPNSGTPLKNAWFIRVPSRLAWIIRSGRAIPGRVAKDGLSDAKPDGGSHVARSLLCRALGPLLRVWTLPG